jgi:hypothetical protein
MEQLADAFKTIFTKISDFFDIFDVSYFVAGITSISALIYWYEGSVTRFKDIKPEGFQILLAIILCYVVGFLSTTIGRRFNYAISKFEKYVYFQKILISLKLEDKLWFSEKLLVNPEENSEYQYTRGSLRNVYVLMWAELRERKDIPESLSLTKRYWANSATLDGLTLSIMLWILVLSKTFLENKMWESLSKNYDYIFIVVILISLNIIIQRESNRFRRYQIEELFSTFSRIMR